MAPKSPPSQRPLQIALKKARRFMEDDRPEHVLHLLERLRTRYPRSAELYQLLGQAWDLLDLPSEAIASYEHALALRPADQESQQRLLRIYAEQRLLVHALDLARTILARQPDDELAAEIVEVFGSSLQMGSGLQGLEVQQFEQVNLLMERGRLALMQSDPDQAVATGAELLQTIPDWPPARIFFSSILLDAGHPDQSREQIEIALSMAPQNVAALTLLIRLHVLSGRPEEARRYWLQVQALDLKKANPQTSILVAKAAALLQEDQAVYDLLQPMFPSDTEMDCLSADMARKLLAAAAANLGYFEEAIEHAEILYEDSDYEEWAEQALDYLRLGEPGMGWLARYPYFTPDEIVPTWLLEDILDRLEQRAWADLEEEEAQEIYNDLRALLRQKPGLLYLAEYLIWVTMMPELGIPLLDALGSEPAQEMLRRFALGQAGDEEQRIDALVELANLGALSEQEPLRFWWEGEWRETTLASLLRQIGLVEWPYDPALYPLMQRATEYAQDDHLDEAEALYWEILEQAPQIKEAYNNLGVIYARRQDFSRAQELFQQALELDRCYVLPCCNLALFALREADIETARDWLAPLAEDMFVDEQEEIMYRYTQASLALAENDWEEARRQVELGLRVDPENEGLSELRERLPFAAAMQSLVDGAGGLAERSRRQRQRKHQQMRESIRTTAPSLKELLNVYTKDNLTGMAHLVLPEGGWSALRKADLIAALQQALLDRARLARLVDELPPKAREALRSLLQEGGAAPGRDFLQRYGDDADESPYWKYHYENLQTKTGQLRGRGLLAEGMVEDELWVMVPQELREPLGELVKERRLPGDTDPE